MKQNTTIKEAVVIDEDDIKNVPLNHEQVKVLPIGLTENTTWSKRGKWNNKASKFVVGNRYNQPVAIKAKEKRRLLKELEQNKTE